MINTSTYRHYLTNLLEGNKKTCLQVVQDLHARKIPIKTIYEGLFRESLYEVGRRWENNQISVAVEHLATSITESLMNSLYPAIFSSERVGRSAMIACVPDELHQIGAKMIADLFELHGWDGYFLGSNTPRHDILSFIQAKQPDLVGFSVSLFFHLPALEQLLLEAKKQFPKQQFLIGGQGFSWGGHETFSGQKNVTLIQDLNQFETMIAGFG